MTKYITFAFLLLFVSPALCQEQQEVDIPKEVLQRVDALGERIDLAAEKLGVGAEHMWAVIVKQKYIEGMISIVIFPIVLVLLFFAFIFCFQKANDPKNSEGRAAAFAVPTVVFGLIWVVLFVTVLTSFNDSITKLVNPEYHAAMEVKSLLTGSGN